MNAFLACFFVLWVCSCSSGGSGASPAPVDLARPRILVNAGGISVDGEVIGPSLPDKQAKVEPLFAKLKQRATDWEMANPNKDFTGHADVEVAPGVSCLSVLGVLQTTLFAAKFATFTLRDSNTKLDIPMTLGADSLPSPERRAFFTFHADGTVDLRPTLCLGVFDTVPGEALPGTVKDWCGDKDDCLTEARIRCDESTPFQKVLSVLDGLRKVSAKVQLVPGGAVCSQSEKPVPRPPVATDKEIVFDEFSPPWVPPAALDPTRKYAWGRVTERITRVTGGLDPQAVNAAVHARADDLQSCYVAGLARNPNVEGLSWIHLNVGRKGAVTGVRDLAEGPDAANHIMLDSEVRACAAGALTQATFPTALGAGAEVIVELTYSPTHTYITPPRKK